MASVDCEICYGKRPFCIHKSYPLPKVYSLQKQVEEKLSTELFGPSYSIFVGNFGYPNVNIGPLTSLNDNGNIDDPSKWFGMSYSDIIEIRSFLIRSKQKSSIFSKDRFIEDNQELAIAKRATDTEVIFEKKPFYKINLSEVSQPMGPSATLKKMRITENVKVDPRIDKIVGDDLKSQESVGLLYKQKQDVYKISTILSSGILGVEENRKLVPTRWSITAIDDIIGKKLIEEIKDYQPVNEFLVFESFYMDNRFMILLMPGSWEFENFETWAPQSNWHKPTEGRIIEEYEPYTGRTKYADKQAGGYYAARLGILEGLKRMRRQARVMSFREIYEGYRIPLGVWQVRENVRNAFRNNPKKFQTLNKALEYIGEELRVKMEDYRKKSVILKQKRLFDFV